MIDLIGHQLENYRIEALLGEGSTGVVYRATDLNLARSVALKVMHPQYTNQSHFQQRFMREVRLAARLNHPSIVTIYSFDYKHNLLYIVMELVPGLSLGVYLKKLAQQQQVTKLKESLSIIAQVADALGYAHRQGVIHHEIKPDNILIQSLEQLGRPDEPSIRAVITDFGIAKLLEGGIQTETGTFMGTLPYMSPEQALAEKIDGRSDIYSLGVVLYQLVTGRLPFDIKSPADAVMKYLREIPPPRQIQPGLPTAVPEVINKALAKNPEGRYQSGNEMAQSLREAMGTLTDKDVTAFATATDHAVVSMMTELESASAAIMPSRMDADETFERNVDQLVISQRGEEPQVQKLDKPTLTIGRQSGNDLVLLGQMVSRRHTRLEKTAASWQIVDLGSSTGTYLDGNKLLPDVPETWLPGQIVRIGPFFLQLKPAASAFSQPSGGLTYQSTAQQSVPPGASQIYGGSGQLGVVVHPTNVEVAPGGRADIQVSLINQGITVDQFTLQIQGLPSDWVTLPEEAPQLTPGMRSTLPLTFHPPADISVRSGLYRYLLMVTSAANKKVSATFSGMLMVKVARGLLPEVELHRLLISSFNIDELETLCFEMRYSADDVPGSTLSTKARGLIDYSARRNRLLDLVEACRASRPKVIWPTLSEESEAAFSALFERVLTIAHPRRLSRKLQSTFIISIHTKETIDKERQLTVEALAAMDKLDVAAITARSLEFTPTDRGIILRLSSRHIDFLYDDPSGVLLNLDDRQPTKTLILGTPRPNCPIATPIKIRISIRDKASGVELLADAINVQVDDFAFDGVPRPHLINSITVITILAALITYILTGFQQLDTTIGFVTGTALVLTAVIIGITSYSTYYKLLSVVLNSPASP